MTLGEYLQLMGIDIEGDFNAHYVDWLCNNWIMPIEEDIEVCLN